MLPDMKYEPVSHFTLEGVKIKSNAEFIFKLFFFGVPYDPYCFIRDDSKGERLTFQQT